MKVKLSEILTGLEMVNSENSVYLSLKSGQAVLLSYEEISAAEDEDDIDDFPEWQHENIAIAREIRVDESKDYIALPDDFDIDEYRMMQDFVATVSDDNIATTLAISIKGSGAFRRFKEHLYQYEIQDQWFAFRDNEYKQMAIQWCQDNNVEYIEDHERGG